MSYLRFGILLLTLLILSDSFSLVLAQSIYQFKTRDTTFHLQKPEQNRLSIIPGGSPYLKLNPNMIFSTIR